MANEKRLIEFGEALRMVKNSKQDCPETSVKGRAIWETAHNCALSCLISCNAVDAVEVVHGQWLDGYAVDHNGKKAYDSIDCSVCNDIFKIETEDREYWKDRFKVCPFCGAIMDGGNEDG